MSHDEQFVRWVRVALIVYVLFFSVVIHEVAHGLTALLCGDPTARDLGRLSLNPLKHFSPVGTLLVPAVLHLSGAPVVFGWAKPVPFNPLRLKTYPRDQVAVSMSGPVSNLLLSFLSFMMFLSLAVVHQRLFPDSEVHMPLDLLTPLVSAQGFSAALWFVLLETSRFAILINTFLAVFNLIPLPPLDGFWILRGLLPQRASAFLGKIQIYGFIILLVALVLKVHLVFFYPYVVVLAVYQAVSLFCLG
jgi:Zn-dependent protease